MKKIRKHQNDGINPKSSRHSDNKKNKIIFPGFVEDLIKDKFVKTERQVRFSKLFFSIGLCISLLFIITAFEWKFYNKGNILDLGEINSNFENIVEVPPTQQPPTPNPKIIQPKIIEVPDEEEIMEDIQVDLDIEMTEEQTIDQPVFDELAMEIVEEKADEIFTIVEQQPEPVGGYKTFYEYVSQNLKYPPRAIRNSIQGRVYIQFVVEKDGSLTDIQVLKGIGGGCDEEACRIISEAPKWKPGKQRGRPVRVKMVMPVLFRLEEA